MAWYRKLAQSEPIPSVPETKPVVQPPVKEEEKPITAAVVLWSNGHVLLLKRGPTAPWMPNAWNLPGGIGEPGENPQQTAIRECQEEAGIAPSGLTLINKVVIEGWPVQFFGASAPSRNITMDSESSDSAWIDPRRIDDYLCVPGVADAIKQYTQRMQNVRTY